MYITSKTMSNPVSNPIGQGWPNCGSPAACSSSNLCMRLFELSKKLHICFLFPFQSEGILQSGAVEASVPHSFTFLSCFKKNFDVTEA